MAEYVFTGPHPVPDEDSDSGELVRFGDVREFDEDPGWGLWERAGGDEPAAPPPPPPAPAKPSGPAAAADAEPAGKGI